MSATATKTAMAAANARSTPKELTNLASSANHASVLFATDEWFATADNLLNPAPPAFVPDLFCAQGKVMDGWETRRRRSAGHDWCVIKLSSGADDDAGTGGAYAVSYLELDTAYFTGNQAPRVSVEAMRVVRPTTGEARHHDNDDYLYDWMPGASARLARGGGKGVRGTGQSAAVVERALEACRAVARNALPHNAEGKWITILPIVPLQPGHEGSRYHTFEISEEAKRQIEELGGVTHLKLNYYPDGGVARMKVYGHPCHKEVETNQKEGVDAASSTDESATPKTHPHSSPTPPPSARPHPFPELSSELHGGRGLACSNKHYGVPSNLLRPYPGKDMGDGWETARHPDRPAVVRKDPKTGLQDTTLMDWSVIKLGLGGAKDGEGVDRIIVDTKHFKGNFPESVAIDGCFAEPDAVPDEVVNASAGENGSDGTDKRSKVEWFPLLKRTPMTADAEHEFLRELGHVANGHRGVTHIRISITPDGGLSRVRIYGNPKAGGGAAGEDAIPRSHL